MTKEISMKGQEPLRRLTPDVSAGIEDALDELAELKGERARLNEAITSSNDRLGEVESRLRRVWAELDGMLEATLG